MRRISFLMSATMISLICASCYDENELSPRNQGYTTTLEGGVNREIGSLIDRPNENRVPYPRIIHRTYIPDYEFWNHTRCQAWRIEWPDYNASVTDDEIPTVFSTSNGALNSFKYLNNVSAAATHNADFSIYYEEKLQNIGTMWAELDHADALMNDQIKFLKKDYDLETIMHMVTERPSLFADYWEPSNEVEFDYNAGDFLLWKNEDDIQYGGIRIVSINPRIIEVYLSEPNI